MVRRSSNINTQRLEHIFPNPNLELHYGDITDSICLSTCLKNIKAKYPEMTILEIYNLAAQSHVKISFEMPEYTTNSDALGTLKLLEAIRSNKLESITRFYQASTSELYGEVQEIPQKETTPFYPKSPYGIAKLYSFWITKNYREAYGMFCSNGILFNHGGIRRGHNFVERKITMGLGKILRGETDKLVMGNLNSQRDIGSSKDYVEGMWLILQHNKPDDFVLATGKIYSIRELIEKAFRIKGFNIMWKGQGVNEIGYDVNTKRELIFIDPKYFRSSEVNLLLGDSSKAEKILGWKAKTTIDELLKEMVDYDCQ